MPALNMTVFLPLSMFALLMETEVHILTELIEQNVPKDYTRRGTIEKMCVLVLKLRYHSHLFNVLCLSCVK